MKEENTYMFTRIRLSKLYDEIGKFLKEYGDADIRSIASGYSSDDKIMYMLRLSDLNSFDTTKSVGEIRIKYEDFTYTKEEWETGIITDSKINTKFVGNQSD